MAGSFDEKDFTFENVAERAQRPTCKYADFHKDCNDLYSVLMEEETIARPTSTRLKRNRDTGLNGPEYERPSQRPKSSLSRKTNQRAVES